MDTVRVPKDVTAIAPDGSEIRELVKLDGGSMVHCLLTAGSASQAVQHRTVQELWFCVSGEGEVWRSRGESETVVSFEPGVSLSIETGTRFQFRAFDGVDLEFVIVTIPPWPGENEADPVTGRWTSDAIVQQD